MVISDPLDLQNVLINEVSGSMLIFIFLSTAVIFYFAAKFRMPSLVSTIMLVLWFLIVSLIYPPLAVLVAVGCGLFIGWQFIKLLQR